MIYRKNTYVAPRRGPRISLTDSHARFRKAAWQATAFAVVNAVVGCLPLGVGVVRYASVFLSGTVAFVVWWQNKKRNRFERLWRRKRFNLAAHAAVTHVDFDEERKREIVAMARRNFLLPPGTK